MTGASKASGLSKRVITLEYVIRLYQFMHDRLKYMRPSIDSLVNQAASAEEFAKLGFLAECGEKMRTGESFSESWRESVSRNANALGKQSAAIVADLSGILGRSDLESQLAALEYGKSMLETRLVEAREYASRHGRLYRTLGVLAGLGLAVLII